MPREQNVGAMSDAGCRFCGMPWKQTIRLFCGASVAAELRVCNAHAGAVQLGDWALTVRCADMTRTLEGGDAG